MITVAREVDMDILVQKEELIFEMKKDVAWFIDTMDVWRDGKGIRDDT